MAPGPYLVVKGHDQRLVHCGKALGQRLDQLKDTCVPDPDPAKNCVTNPQAQKLRPGQGAAIRQVKGPPLFLQR